MSRTYSDRVMRFRRAVYAKRPDLTNGCRVLLLRLSDGMDAKCIVSIPRSTLAEELGVAPARITEWIAQAKDHGFLSVVRRARPGVTAVYQGLIAGPVEVRPGVPLSEVRPPGRQGVRPGVPQNGAQRYALGGSQVERANLPLPPDERRVFGEPGKFPAVDEPAVDRVPDEGKEEEERSA